MSAPIIILPVPTVNFRASLIQLSGAASITANADCTELTITDSSDYVGNTESGHSKSDFSSFRRILIEHYKGTIINLSSIGDGDVVITPAYLGINVFTQPVSTGDGRYNITLRTVPDWNSSTPAQYQAADDCVFVPGTNLPTSGIFYRAIADNTTSDPATNPLDWEVIAEVDLPVKYNTELFIVLDCALLTCINEKVDCAICKMEDAFCDSNMLCQNKCFLDAAKLQMLYFGIQIDVQNQSEEGVDKKFDMVSKLCSCNTGNC